MASASTHPLPAPPPQDQGQFYQHQQYQPHPQQQPQQQQPAVTRPAPVTSKSRTFSFHSDKSHKSSNRYHETHQEKEAKRLHSKADPTLAINEAEPSAVQATERTMLAPLRSIQHRDPFGNPIAEPDRSNPTRSRWERPLDTIRSFEAAIDGGYSSRKSIVRSEADWNRRSSYYGSKQFPPQRAPSALSKRSSAFAGNGPRFPQDSYYGGRPASQFDPRSSARDSFYEGYGGASGSGPYGPGPSRGQRAPRMQSEPQLSGYHRPEPNPNSLYPLQHRDRSYETVTSAAGSGTSGDQGSYHTDPSSENSSVDRASPAKLPPQQPPNDYGIGFSSSPAYQPPAFTIGTNPNIPPTIVKKPVGSASDGPPPVPTMDQAVLGRPLPPQRPVEPEKRKSWFMRRFSRAS